MCGNGVMIGMEITAVIHKQIQEELQQALTACSAAVAGSAVPGAVGLLIVATTILATAAAA